MVTVPSADGTSSRLTWIFSALLLVSPFAIALLAVKWQQPVCLDF
jgi:hypothetical protein